MKATKISKKPKVLLVETIDYMYDLLRFAMNSQDQQLFELHRVDELEKALEMIKKGEKFDAVIFDLDGWLWLRSFFYFETAEEIRRLNDKIAIIASVCCDACFDPQRCKEMNMYRLPDGGFTTSLAGIKDALRECGVLGGLKHGDGFMARSLDG